jgi:hypothetical protein
MPRGYPPPWPGTKLRKREVAFAVALGAIAAGGAAVILAESHESSAPVVETAAPRTYHLAEFDEISTIGPQHVVVTVGGAQAIRSEGPDEALGLLEVVVEDGKLIIKPKEGFGDRFENGDLDSATFFVTLPALEAVSVGAAGEVVVDSIDGDSFAGSIAGAGALTIGAMKVDNAEFSIAGSGDIAAAGTARDAEITIAGSGDVRAGGLRSQTGTVSIAGAGDVELTVDREAQVSIIGAGDVEIGGSARCSVTRIGGGDVRCAGGETE